MRKIIRWRRRGGIIDVFDLTEENPYRIELWGDDVESIRSFDILSQRSIENLESVSIYPAAEMVLSREELTAGLTKIEKEGKEYAEKLRREMKTEEAHRVTKQIGELKEQLLELGVSLNAVNLESYIRYFYPTLSSFLEVFPAEQSCVFIDEPIRVGEHADAVEM